MKKIYLLLIAAVLFSSFAFAQVTVTNPANTTPNLAATYPSLANAITALNTITAISGSVTITLNAGNNQTAPAGGYAIQFAANATISTPIIIEGSSNTITASSALTVGATGDAIFKLIGVDFVTIQHFVMQENAANTVTAPQASNNMTEFAVAILRGSATDGAQNNTIQNNTISLNKNYQDSYGIYSNVRSTAAAVTVVNDITNATGANSGNKIYGNNISNVNFGIVFIGTALAGGQDVGNDIGGSAPATGNTISNWGGLAPLAGYPSNSPSSYCIFVNNQTNENVSYNTITSAAVSGTPVTFVGIRKDYSASQPVGTVTSTISHNTITMSSGFASGTFDCILSQGMSTLSTATINITNNNLLNNELTAAGTTSTFTGIINTSASGALSISNNVIRGLNSVSTGAFSGITNSGTVVNTISINNNQLGNSSGGLATYTVASTATVNCIINNFAGTSASINMQGNSIDGFSGVSFGQVSFVSNLATGGSVINVNNNHLGTATGNLITFNGVQSSNIFCVYSQNSTGSASVSLQANDITGIVAALPLTGVISMVQNASANLTQTISNNTFTNLNINSSGYIYLVSNSSAMISGASFICNNNQIVTAFNKTASGGGVVFLLLFGSAVSGSVISVIGNNFSDATITGATSLSGISEGTGTSGTNGPTKTITGNTLNNITVGTSSASLIAISKGISTNCSYNTISNVNGQGAIYCLSNFTADGDETFSNNTISNISSTGGNVIGIYGGVATVNSININNNSISNLSSMGVSSIVSGMDINAVTTTINDNTINAISGSGTTSPLANGILIKTGATINVYNNKIYDISEIGALSTTSPAVNGMVISGGTTVTVYNNFVCDLKAPNANLIDAIRGISVTSTSTSSMYNILFNSIYINASSTGTNFGSSGIYHTASAAAATAPLDLIDNIIMNTSTPNGTGVTAAYRRSSIALANYFSISDHNLFYAGTPGATKLIYYDGTNADQTLAAYQTRVSTRDANSISLPVNFYSSTNLHLLTTDCSFNNKGIPAGPVLTDIDGYARDGSAPDIGAVEVLGYSATANAALATSTVNGSDLVRGCDDGVWTYYTDPGDAARFLFGIQWDPLAIGDNITAKDFATVRLQVDGNDFSVNNSGIPEGTWTMRRFWNVDLHTAHLTNPVNIRFFYSAAEKAITDGEAASFQSVYGGSVEPPTWFQIKTTTFANDALHMNADGVLNAAGLVDVNAAPALTLNNVLYAQFNSISNLNGGTYATGVGPNTPLPVTFNYLRGVKQSGSHLLSWKVTCNQTPKVALVLERSADARTFNDVYSITADAARCQQEFTHTDANPLNGINYYRLRIIDADGKITYSNIISLLNAVKGFEVMNIAPNPVTTGSFKLNVTSAAAGRMDIVITDMQGRVVGKQTVTLIAGYNSLDMNAINLAAGTYNIYGNTDQDKSKMIRFVKQ